MLISAYKIGKNGVITSQKNSINLPGKSSTLLALRNLFILSLQIIGCLSPLATAVARSNTEWFRDLDLEFVIQRIEA